RVGEVEGRRERGPVLEARRGRDDERFTGGTASGDADDSTGNASELFFQDREIRLGALCDHQFFSTVLPTSLIYYSNSMFQSCFRKGRYYLYQSTVDTFE